MLASMTKPSGRASVFKVAHHGSITGHHPQVWEDMLDQSVIAVLTPWNLASHSLPRLKDCSRVSGLSSSAYSTSGPVASRVRVTQPVVARTLRDGNISLRNAEPNTGCVRLRATIHDPAPAWSILLSHGAMELNDYASALK